MRTQSKTPLPGRTRLVRAVRACGIFLLLLVGAAALHPPRYADGSQQSQDANLAECLRYMRTQVYVYGLEHNGAGPGFPGNNIAQPPDSETFVAQLTQYTDDSGRISGQKTPQYKHGPYLTAVPANPVNLRNAVLVVTTAGTPRADDSKPYGWIYNPASRQILPNLVGADSQGVSYASY